MIRVRGGIQSICKPLDMKIYRAALLPSVDHLRTPKLPRLRATVPSLHKMIMPDAAPNSRLSQSMATTGMNLHMIDIMLDMNALSRSVQYATDHELTVPCRSFDEDTMGIQHDLLMLIAGDATDINIAARSAALIYMNSLTREDMFVALTPRRHFQSSLSDRCDVDPVVDALIGAVKRIEVNVSNVNLLFWTKMMGAMFAQQLGDRTWFCGQLSMLCEAYDIFEWYQVESILQSISWISKVHNTAGQETWDIVKSMLSPSNRLTPSPPT